MGKGRGGKERQEEKEERIEAQSMGIVKLCYLKDNLEISESRSPERI